MIDFIEGFFAPWLLYALIFALHLCLPARRIRGYVLDPKTCEPFGYRLNGPLVLFAVVGLWYLVGRFDILSLDWLYAHRWPGLLGSCAFGLAFSLALVLPAPSSGRPFLSDFYKGRLDNPQWLGGRVDAKMFLYLAGAVTLELNVLSFAAHHEIALGAASSPGVILYAALFTWFIVDYLVFERVHLYTYDFFAERVGFKLGWGCLLFYPYFYAVGIWVVAELPNPGQGQWFYFISALVFLTGWALSRGANMQKFLFKIEPDRAFLGFMRPKTLSDGNRSLLYGGFWGVSRHINYLGEILMAIGLSLSLGWPSQALVWLYPLYYLALLLPRERSDERRCREKYGELWEEYERLVPKRIVPRVY